jgi:two-component system LytT family sensor kinase
MLQTNPEFILKPLYYMNPIFTYTKPHLIASLFSWICRYRIHLIAWLCFITNEVLAARFVAGRFGPLANYLVHYSINISFFYLNAHYLLPLAFKSRYAIYLRIPLVLFSGLVLYLGANYLADQVLSYFTTHVFAGKYLRVTQYFLFTSMWRGIYFLGFSTGYYFISAYLRSKLATERAERQILEQLVREKQSILQLARAKNAYLQAQINPHFLFNSFNFIYSRSRKSDPDTAQAIILLTRIMRYSLESNHGSSEIRIIEEIAQVKNLIEFWQLRQGYTLPLTFECTEAAAEVSFIPLVLLTLTENMLIHGDLSAKQPASFKIVLRKQILEISTENATYLNQKSSGLNSGLGNVKERLNYAYGDRATIAYGQSAEKHLFKLKIKLDLVADKTTQNV